MTDAKETLHQALCRIQQELKVPKNQRNNFGNYNYRSCEDILEAVKPLLKGLRLTITDSIELIGDRYYVKAEVRLSNGEEKGIKTVAYAREEETRKGMDGSQITGSSSSYARKYALNGLFLIDDTKDADSQDNSKNGSTTAPVRKFQPKSTTPDPIMEATKKQTSQPKCPECGATGQFHRPDCSLK